MSTATAEPTTPDTGRIACPEPGVYHGVPARDYHRWDAASNSGIKPGERSALHMRLAMLEPIDPSKYMDEGSALHAAVLERHLFDSLVIAKGQCAALKKDETRCSNEGSRYRLDNAALPENGGAWFCGVKGHDPYPEAPDDGTGEYIVISEEAAGHVEACAEAIWMHPEAADLLDGAEYEVSIVWDDPETGVRCKARLDIWNPRTAKIGDIKKVQNASPDVGHDCFPRILYNRGYYRQAAMYADAAVLAGLTPIAEVEFIAAELEPPHGVAVYPVHEDTLELGSAEYHAFLRLYQASQKQGVWQGYSLDNDPLQLEGWQVKQIHARLMRL